MRISGPLLSILTVATMTIGAIAMVALVMWTDNRALQWQIADLREQRRAALEDSRESERQRQSAEQSLALERERGARIADELSALKAQQSAVSPETSEPQRAVRAQVYAGRQTLGYAWVLPAGGSTHRAGRNVEPVVLLDESVLRTFRTALAREVVTPPAPREVVVNHNYPTATPWSGWWPVWYVLDSSSTNVNHPNTVPQLPSKPKPPGDGGSTRDGIYRPTEKPFLPSPSPWPIVTPPRNQPFTRAALSQNSVSRQVTTTSRPATRPVMPKPSMPTTMPLPRRSF